MWIVCPADDSYKMLSLLFLEKYNNILEIHLLLMWLAL